MKDKVEKRLMAVLVVALGVLGWVAVTAVRNIQQGRQSSDWVNHSYAALLEAESLLSSLHAGEAALRSYLLTDDARDLAACREAYNEMSEHLDVAKALLRQELLSPPVLPRLQALLTQRVEWVSRAVKARQEQGPAAARKLLAADAGGAGLREVQRLVKQLREAQMATLRERDKAAYLQAQSTRWTIWTGVATNFLLLALAVWLVRDDLAARRRAAGALEAAKDQLEARVQERTAELGQANAALQSENLERQWTNQALEHQLRYSQLIFDGIGDLVLVISKAQNILRLNPAVEQRTGWAARELVGRPLAQLLSLTPPADHPPAAGDPVALALKHGHELQDCPAWLQAKSAPALGVRLKLFPLRERDKVVGGIVVMQLPAEPPARL